MISGRCYDAFLTNYVSGWDRGRNEYTAEMKVIR